MHPTKTTIRRLVCTAGLVLTAVVAFPTGAAANQEFIPGVTDFPSRLDKVGESSPTVSQERFVPGVTDFPSRLGEAGERAAEARLAQRSLQGVPISVQTEASGFDWSAATTGALAATLLLLGAALAVRVGRRSIVAVG